MGPEKFPPSSCVQFLPIMELDLLLPEHLQVAVIQKLNPKSFTRSFRSCYAFKAVIEANRKRISIKTPLKLSIENRDGPEKEILIQASRGQNIVFWSKEVSYFELLEAIIPLLAYFSFARIGFKLSSSFSEEKLKEILATFKKYRIEARRAVNWKTNRNIGEIIETLKVKEFAVTGARMNMDCDISMEDASKLDSLSISHATGPAAAYLLEDIAPVSKNFSAHLFGEYLPLIRLFAYSLKKIQKSKKSERKGQIAIIHYSGNSLSTAEILEQFHANNQSDLEFHEELKLILLPFDEEKKIAVSWKNTVTPLNKIVNMHLHYAVVGSRQEMTEHFKASHKFVNDKMREISDCSFAK